MRKRALRIAVFAFFFAMVAWLIRFEAYPEWFAGSTFGYRDIMPDDVLMMDFWAKVLHEGAPIGYTRTHVDVNEEEENLHYEVRNLMHLRLNLMGSMQRMHTDTRVLLNTRHQLQSFTCKIKSAAANLVISGKRIEGTRYKVTHTSDAGSRDIPIDIPEDAIIYSPMTEMAVRELKPGQTLSLRTFDPVSLSNVDVLMEALRLETITNEGKEIETTVIRSAIKGMEFLSWVDDTGRTMRQTTPFGWSMEACSPENAILALKEAADQPDLLASLAVPCRGELNDPRNCRSLQLNIQGGSITAEQLRTARQEVVSVSADSARVNTRRQALGDAAGEPAAEPMTTEMLAPWLEASASIQSDHADLKRTAATIVRGANTKIEKARAISAWVDSQVVNEITVSVPSALDVLRTRRGDCNEHTYLFAGLARASGIPTKVMVGLVYQDGSFYYHAWPAVYVDDHWFDLDPTFGQNDGADATHISLVEGELASQLDIMRLLGQLRITVLEEEPDDD